jgi:serine protease Do
MDERVPNTQSETQPQPGNGPVSSIHHGDNPADGQAASSDDLSVTGSSVPSAPEPSTVAPDTGWSHSVAPQASATQREKSSSDAPDASEQIEAPTTQPVATTPPLVTFQPVRISPPPDAAFLNAPPEPVAPVPQEIGAAGDGIVPLAASRNVVPLPAANARAVTLSPILSMLLGGVLACVLVALGMSIGARRSGGAGGDPIAFTSAQPMSSSTGSNDIVRAVQIVGPAVMNVDTQFSTTKDPDFLPSPGMGDQPAQGKGTGVIIRSSRGPVMLTNAHVVAGAKRIQVTTRNGDKYTGKIIGSDRQTDIAVVEISNKKLPIARLATLKSTKDLAVGDWVIAIGNPYAQANTVTVGVLSAVGRRLAGPGRDGQMIELTDMIQTDAAINPGNSGGPLCNLRGEVIGINTAIIPFATGLGFSIPINKAKAIADQLIAQGRVRHPFIGVLLEPITDELKSTFGLKDKLGALVKSVTKNSPASKAGLQEGDVIRRVDGTVIKDFADVPRLIKNKKVGESVTLEILRNSTVTKNLKLKIGEKPADE